MLGTLHVIGIGPGDPDLITVKAVRIIQESGVLCVPKGREEGSSLALSITQKAVSLEGKEIMEAHFPMRKTRKSADNDELDAKWSETANALLSKLRSGDDVAFLTLGDPTIYSTYFYLHDRLLKLQPDLNIEIVPGVSSINAAAARANIYLGLGNERIAVLPANYMENLRTTLEAFDSIVLMKVNRVYDEIVKTLDDMGLLNRAVCVSRTGMDDEHIIRNLKDMKQEDLNYFSMVIVKK